MNKIQMNIYKLFIFTSLVISKSAVAGAPFVTDDPETLADNRWEVNYAISKTWMHNSTSVTAPSIDINYGLSKHVQLHMQPRYTYQRNGHDKQSGFDSTELGIKNRFFSLNLNDIEFMLGIYPKLQLPTGTKKLGDASGKTQLFLPFWAQVNTDKWTLYGGTGYRINNYSSSKNSWFLGLTALYEVTENFKFGGELYRESAVVQGNQYSSGFNIGSIYNITKDYGVLFSAGRALNNVSETNKLSAFVALQVIY
jgi:hypothetical protein